VARGMVSNTRGIARTLEGRAHVVGRKEHLGQNLPRGRRGVAVSMETCGTPRRLRDSTTGCHDSAHP
jgi:hypothetical protein